MAFPYRHLDELALSSLFGGRDSRYAPTPRLIFSPNESFLNASVIPRMASGGPSFTPAKVDARAILRVLEIWRTAARPADRVGDNMVRCALEKLLDVQAGLTKISVAGHSVSLVQFRC